MTESCHDRTILTTGQQNNWRWLYLIAVLIILITTQYGRVLIAYTEGRSPLVLWPVLDCCTVLTWCLYDWHGMRHGLWMDAVNYCVFAWSNYRMGNLHLHLILCNLQRKHLGLRSRWESSPLFKGYWQSLCTAPNDLPLNMWNSLGLGRPPQCRSLLQSRSQSTTDSILVHHNVPFLINITHVTYSRSNFSVFCVCKFVTTEIMKCDWRCRLTLECRDNARDPNGLFYYTVRWSVTYSITLIALKALISSMSKFAVNMCPHNTDSGYKHDNVWVPYALVLEGLTHLMLNY